jgi:hypothetical protein
MAQSSPETTTTAELLAGYVHAAGVRHAFGYCRSPWWCSPTTA